jgi:probable F420-dependent oxidoreductase
MTERSTQRPFRFAVVAAPTPRSLDWTDWARKIEAMGYDALLIPDTSYTAEPLLAAAVAATATSTLRVGSYVLAAPLRPPAVVAWEVQSLQSLTGGRFELGLGAGRPDTERDAASLGVPCGTPSERIRQVAATIRAVRERCGDGAPRVLVAGSGPRLLALAARQADTVELGLGPRAGVADLGHAVSIVRDAAAERFDEIELAQNLLAVGSGLTPAEPNLPAGMDVGELAAAGSVSVLCGSPKEISNLLARRRDRYAISYLSVSAGYAEAFAPVVDRLAGT